MSDVADQIVSLVAQKENGPEVSKITMTANLIETLGYSSLDMVEFKIRVEDAFSIGIDEATAVRLNTVGDWINYVAARV